MANFYGKAHGSSPCITRPIMGFNYIGGPGMEMRQGEAELKDFLANWPQEEVALKQAYLAIKTQAEGLAQVAWSFVPRPGVSYSLRFDLAPRPQGRERPLFFLLDVVDVDGVRMLSACFYAEEMTDPEELGDAIPGGLFGETGYCFDLEGDAQELAAYVSQRVAEAHAAARRA